MLRLFGKASGSDSGSRSGTGLEVGNSVEVEKFLEFGNCFAFRECMQFEECFDFENCFSSPTPRGLPGGNLGLFRQTCFPLLIYYATASEIPLANGAYRQGAAFWKRSLFVSLISFTTDSPPRALRFYLATIRDHLSSFHLPKFHLYLATFRRHLARFPQGRGLSTESVAYGVMDQISVCTRPKG